MERNSNYALVGLATTLLFLGLVFFVIWLARLQSSDDYDQYDDDPDYSEYAEKYADYDSDDD